MRFTVKTAEKLCDTLRKQMKDLRNTEKANAGTIGE
jgi:hypothetical protein